MKEILNEDVEGKNFTPTKTSYGFAFLSQTLVHYLLQKIKRVLFLFLNFFGLAKPLKRLFESIFMREQSDGSR